MVLSDQIARLIEQMLEDGGGHAEVKRNDLAAKVGCVPSQINYVITSRFTPARGYMIESRRGGGGYIRIERVQMGKKPYLMHLFQAVGGSLEENEVRAYLQNLMENGILTSREASLAMAAMSADALERVPKEARSAVRADIFRRMLLFRMME